MTAEELVSRAGSIPTLSPAIPLLLDLLNSESNSSEVLRVAQQDAVITGKVLALCNSAAFGVSPQVGSLRQAILRLGYQQVFRLVIAVAFGDKLRRPMPAYGIDAAEQWRHSLVVALMTQPIMAAGPLARSDGSIGYTAGILHDIGKVVLHEVLDEAKCWEIRALIATGTLSRVEAERKVLGTDHAEVGAVLLEHWRLPPPVIEAVRNHHRPVCAPEPNLSAVVHVANAVAHEIGSAPGWDSFAVRLDEKALAALKVGDRELEQIVAAAFDVLNTVNELAAVA